MTETGRGYPFDEGTSPLFDHSKCVAVIWSQRTHNHEDVAGAFLFPDELPRTVPPELRTADGELIREGLYLQDGRSLFKVSTCYEHLVTLQVCLDNGELTDRTRVREYAAAKARHLRVANQGLVSRYHKLLDDQRRRLGPMQPHGFEQDPDKTGSACKYCGLSNDNPVHKGEGPL